MATVNALGSAKYQSAESLAATLKYCMQEEKTKWGDNHLVTGIHCVPESAYIEMMNTKLYYKKTDGRMFYHFDQSFSNQDDLTPEKVHEIAVRFASEQFKGFEVLVATHTDAKCLHSHFVVNSVSCENGKKYWCPTKNLYQLRAASDALCMEYGLSVVVPKHKRSPKKMSSRESQAALKGQSWKVNLTNDVDRCMIFACSRENFISRMEALEYSVKWVPERKSITYTTPTGKKARDITLHHEKYLKENMENEFRIRSEIYGGIEGTGTEKFGKSHGGAFVCTGEVGALDGTDFCKRNSFADPFGNGRLSQEDGNPDTDAGGHENASGKTGDADASGADSDGRSAGGSAEYSGADAEGAEDGGLRNGETGWEYERELWKNTLGGGEKDYEGRRKDAPTLADFHGSFGSVGSAAAHLLADLGTAVQSEEDPEERRKRNEAQESAENLGAVLGTAIGVAMELADRHLQGEEAEENQDNTVEQSM